MSYHYEIRVGDTSAYEEFDVEAVDFYVRDGFVMFYAADNSFETFVVAYRAKDVQKIEKIYEE